MAKRNRKYSGPRRGRRSKLLARRRIPRVVRGPPAVHRFKEMTRLPDINIPAGGSTAGVISCNINQLINANNFKAMFDLYKITGVKFRFLYRSNSAEAEGAPSGVSLPVLYLATNRDPNVPVPASMGDILNDDSCRFYRLDKPSVNWYVKCPKPDLSTSINVGGVDINVPLQWQFGVSKMFQPWLTTGGNGQAIDQSSVPHFGARYWVDNTLNTSTQVVQCYATLYFTMKEQD